jgi:hypothetical protein
VLGQSLQDKGSALDRTDWSTWTSVAFTLLVESSIPVSALRSNTLSQPSFAVVLPPGSTILRSATWAQRLSCHIHHPPCAAPHSTDKLKEAAPLGLLALAFLLIVLGQSLHGEGSALDSTDL